MLLSDKESISVFEKAALSQSSEVKKVLKEIIQEINIDAEIKNKLLSELV